MDADVDRDATGWLDAVGAVRSLSNGALEGASDGGATDAVTDGPDGAG
ncbi:MAG: hypothetical protein HY329_19970 [Chloroflexi bacterium]|nr:hypothetical protein [Chloroflexota bacterium]